MMVPRELVRTSLPLDRPLLTEPGVGTWPVRVNLPSEVFVPWPVKSYEGPTSGLWKGLVKVPAALNAPESGWLAAVTCAVANTSLAADSGAASMGATPDKRVRPSRFSNTNERISMSFLQY